jgi:DNA polymerase-3 subunit alpha
VNKRVVEAFVKSGAFDSIGKATGVNRAQLFESIETAMERAAQAQRDRKSGQTSLFGLMVAAGGSVGGGGGGASASPALPEKYPALEEWAPKILLGFEKESLGFYITGHPLDRYQGDISRYASANTSTANEQVDKTASIGGIVSEYRERPTKSGSGRMAFFFLQDQYGQIEVIVFPKTFEKLRDVLTLDEPLLCTGKVVDEGEAGQHDYRFLLEDAVPLARVREQKTSRIHIQLNADLVTREQIDELKGILLQHKGSCSTYLHVKIPMRSETVIPLGDKYAVAPSDDLLLRLERLFGDRVAILR